MHIISRKRLNEFASAHPHTEEEYQRLVVVLDSLIDRVGEGESHPLASLIDVLCVLVERYEDQHGPELA